MSAHPNAGKPAPASSLTNIPRLVSRYYALTPDPEDPAQRVSFGTSGHRGVASKGSFNEAHILAITQAVCDIRAQEGVHGPLYLGMDTHALSEPALVTALEVLAANGVEVRYHQGFGYTPTPVISHAILTYNAKKPAARADGVVITPSHNPPEHGGFKYNPPHGGPAGGALTKKIESRANDLLKAKLDGVRRTSLKKALQQEGIQALDLIHPYVRDLNQVIDMESISKSGLKLGVDPMGGAGIHYWGPIAETYGLDLEVVNPIVDPTFSFMTLDHDGKIRMDCSSPWAMRSLISLKERFDLAFGNDPDYDRHGIVTQSGLMNPNHYLSVVTDYLLRTRTGWSRQSAVGKTIVTTSMIDRVAASHQRKVFEVPVGFKWFVPGLLGGDIMMGAEESAGASFLRFDGSPWSTDKDGIILDLLAAEMMAKTQEDPAKIYLSLEERFGSPRYARVERPADRAQKAKLKALSPEAVTDDTLAGDPITSILTKAPGNDAAFGGLKVATAQGWFAARPSGTEEIYKIYAESFKGEAHLQQLLEEATALVQRALG